MITLPLPLLPSFRLGRAAGAGDRGGAGGSGLACAAGLAQAGAAVVLAARTAGELEQAVEAIRAAGGEARAIVLDVLDIAAAGAAITAAGPFDVLVNNAGTNRPCSFLEVSVEDFDAVVNLNVRAAFFAAQAVARGLVAAGRGGSIINVSSQMGHVGGPRRSVYCTSKHAMEGMTKAMALDLGKHGIRVNTICPTFIETPLTAPYFQDPAFLQSVLGKIALGRLGKVEDLMGVVVFLASDASALMTGSSVMVDGGWTAE